MIRKENLVIDFESFWLYTWLSCAQSLSLVTAADFGVMMFSHNEMGANGICLSGFLLVISVVPSFGLHSFMSLFTVGIEHYCGEHHAS